MGKPIFVKKLKMLKSNVPTAELTPAEIKKSTKKTAEAMGKTKSSSPTQFIEVE